MIDILSSFFLFSTEVLAFKLFMETFLEKKQGTNKLRSVLSLLICVVICYFITGYFQSKYLLKSIFIIIIYSVTWCVYFNKLSITIPILFVVCYGVCILGDYLGMLILYLICPGVLQTAYSHDSIGNMCAFLCSFVSLFLVLCIRLAFRKTPKKITAVREWLLYMTLPIYTILVLCIIVQNWSIIETQGQFRALMSVVIGLILVNVITFYLIDISVQHQMAETQSRIKQEQLEYEWKYYKTMESSYTQQKKLAHEFNNQLAHIFSLFKNNCFEELEKYCTSIQDMADDVLEIVDTNNPIINVILNSKVKEALQNQVPCSLNVNDLSNCIIEHEDLVLILSNLFNNAIEASALCENKMIYFEMLQSADELKIKIVNTYAKEPVSCNGRFISQKKNQQKHGYGIENIKDVISKYHGDSCITYREKEFTFLIVIPLQ